MRDLSTKCLVLSLLSRMCVYLCPSAYVYIILMCFGGPEEYMIFRKVFSSAACSCCFFFSLSRFGRVIFILDIKKVFYVRIFRFYCNYVLDACGVVDI